MSLAAVFPLESKNSRVAAPFPVRKVRWFSSGVKEVLLSNTYVLVWRHNSSPSRSPNSEFSCFNTFISKPLQTSKHLKGCNYATFGSALTLKNQRWIHIMFTRCTLLKNYSRITLDEKKNPDLKCSTYWLLAFKGMPERCSLKAVRSHGVLEQPGEITGGKSP